jgi:hypothetical protein
VTVNDEDLSGINVDPQPKFAANVEFTWGDTGPHPDKKAPGEIELLPLRRGWFSGETDFAEQEGSAGISFANLFSDDYAITVSSLAASVYVKDILYGGASIMNKAFHPVPSAGTMWLRVLLGSDGGASAVTVVDSDGKTVPDADVVVMPAGAPSDEALAAMVATGLTSQAGSWLSPTLAPGKYYVYATRSGFNRSPEGIRAASAMRGSATEIEISAGSSLNVRITLSNR